MTLTEKAREIFAKDRFAQGCVGVEITHVGDHEATCVLDTEDCHLNAAGIVMGGALFTLADMAFAAAANSEVIAADSSDRLWVSLDSDIHYLKAAKKGRLTARATMIKSGRTTCLYNIDILDADNKLIATVQSTGIRPL